MDERLDLPSQFDSLLTLCMSSSVAIAFVLNVFWSATCEGFELVCLLSGCAGGLFGGVVVVVRHFEGWMESE